jgi:hypothetical protein
MLLRLPKDACPSSVTFVAAALADTVAGPRRTLGTFCSLPASLLSLATPDPIVMKLLPMLVFGFVRFSSTRLLYHSI